MSTKKEPKELAKQFYTVMYRMRRFEEEVFEFYKRGLMPGLAHLYLGEEAVAAGACVALREDDYIGSTHRGHGHLVARGADLDRMMAEILGKKTGYSKGKGGSMHIMAMDKGILGANGIVGGGIPMATGAGYSAKYRGTDQVTLCFFGDGAANEGTFHESINMAAAWDLPVVYVIENNLYGITVDEVKGEYGGREYHGLTYSATDREGNKVGKPFKSSVFGKEAGVAALERRMHNATAWEKTHKEVAAATAGKVAAAMQSAGHDRAQFERELMRQGIGVVFRQNETGRIYGATFIDHAAKAVFNGSRLGKEFSAGVFNDLFAGQEGIHLPQPSAEVEHPTRQQAGASQWDGQDTGYRPDHKDGTTQNVAAAFNLFAPVPGGASGDQPVPPQRKKKKRRKYGRQQ